MTFSSSPDQMDYAPTMSSIPEMHTLEMPDSPESEEQPRKLAVLGLPWETSEDTLRLHFSQYGVVEAAEVMKDRFSGKSRGFGFVTFVDPASAQRALSAEHTIDGRRCEAKVALPKTLLQGEPLPARTTRIFVARIPAAVTEGQFRAYFEKFGKLQDAYMPKDHSKQAYRGIGFVTYASPDSVEKVMESKHWMNGHEIAIDRATPKEENAGRSQFLRLPPSNQRRSFDNGAGIVGPGLTPVLNYQLSHFGGTVLDPAAAFPSLRPISDERELSDLAQGLSQGLDGVDIGRTPLASSSLNIPTIGTNSDLNGKGGAHFGGMRGGNGNLGLMGLPPGASSAALQNLAKAQAALGQLPLGGAGLAGAMAGISGMGHLGGLQPDLGPSLFGSSMLGKPNMVTATGRKSLDSALLHKRMENPMIANARAGPRIFIGKLTKDTTEADVKDYFSRFGYVMDVYMPKAKDNKSEHRGFGFVTFETDAAIKRVVGAGQHRLKGSTIAIDIAMPKVEDEGGMDVGMLTGMNGGLNGLGQVPFDTAAAAAARQFQATLPMVGMQ